MMFISSTSIRINNNLYIYMYTIYDKIYTYRL